MIRHGGQKTRVLLTLQEDDEAEREMQAEIEAERLQGTFSLGSKRDQTFWVFCMAKLCQ